ncbi:MAG: hypothetical protein WBE70_06055, partial [Candidatus Acidiferrum sp.]
AGGHPAGHAAGFGRVGRGELPDRVAGGPAAALRLVPRRGRQAEQEFGVRVRRPVGLGYAVGKHE